MISKAILAASCFLIAANAAQAAASSPKGMRTVLDTGGQRDFIPLNGPEVRKALIGQRVVLDQQIDWEPNKHSIGFGEAFLPDGSWIINKTMRAVVVETGVWRIHDAQICTRVIQSPFGVTGRQDEVCRQVSRDRLSGKIAMIATWNIPPDVLIFSSSPLK
jgi:hypothetical protein